MTPKSCFKYRWTVFLDTELPILVSLIANVLVDWYLFSKDFAITIFEIRFSFLGRPAPFLCRRLSFRLCLAHQRRMVLISFPNIRATLFWEMPSDSFIRSRFLISNFIFWTSIVVYFELSSKSEYDISASV